jgi:hypothetical protein
MGIPLILEPFPPLKKGVKGDFTVFQSAELLRILEPIWDLVLGIWNLPNQF